MLQHRRSGWSRAGVLGGMLVLIGCEQKEPAEGERPRLADRLAGKDAKGDRPGDQGIVDPATVDPSKPNFSGAEVTKGERELAEVLVGTEREVPYGGQATEDHRVLYCPTGSNAPLQDLWYVFSDQDILDRTEDCWTGTSESFLWTVADPPAPCVVGWTGRTTTAYKHGFAGIGSQAANQDLSAYEAVVLETRGDGRTYRFELGFAQQMRKARLGSCDDPWTDMHGSPFRCGDGTDRWVRVTLPVKLMKQEGWGEPVTPDWSSVERLQIRIADRPILPSTTTPPRFPERNIDGQRTDGFLCDFYIASWVPRQP